jgi:hypothetical protein
VHFKTLLVAILVQSLSFAQQKELDTLDAFAFKFLTTTTLSPLPYDTLTGNWTLVDKETATEFILFSNFIDKITYDNSEKALVFSNTEPVFVAKKDYKLEKTATVVIPCFLQPTQQEIKNVHHALFVLGEQHAMKRIATKYSSNAEILQYAVLTFLDSLKYTAGNVQFILDNKMLFSDDCSNSMACRKGFENYIKTTPVYTGKPLEFRYLFQNQDQALQQLALAEFTKKAIHNWEQKYSPKQQRKINRRLAKRKVSQKNCSCTTCKALSALTTVSN